MHAATHWNNNINRNENEIALQAPSFLLHKCGRAAAAGDRQQHDGVERPRIPRSLSPEAENARSSRRAGGSMQARVGQVLLPGDVAGVLEKRGQDEVVVHVGNGLMQLGNEVRVTKPGVLRYKAPSRFWIENAQKRYVPSVDDRIIGVISSRIGEAFKVDVGGAHPASLSVFGFEGASRKNRPQLPDGRLVYARVTVANRDMDPEIECMDVAGHAGPFGPLEGGVMIEVSLTLASKLLNSECALLNALGQKIPYEIAVGVNGRVWVTSTVSKDAILITNAIRLSETLSEEQTAELVEDMLLCHRSQQ